MRGVRRLLTMGVPGLAWVCATALAMGGCSSGPPRFTAAVDAAPVVDTGSTLDAAGDLGGTSPGFDAFSPDIRPVQTTRDTVLPGAPADAAMRFGGTVDPSHAPTLVYPEDGTIVPPNLPSLEVHFLPGAGNDLFEVSFTGQVTVLRYYTTCTPVGGGCVLALDTPAFASVADAARAGGQVRVSVRGTSMAGGPVGATMPRTLGVTQTELRGAVYYWASSGSVLRYDFGAPMARTEVYAQGNIIQCAGCHVLSRDGTRISIGFGIPAPAPAQIFDVTSRALVGSSFASNFGTFSPDNSHYVASDGVRMTLLDATTGHPVTGAPQIPGSMPDWSPNATDVVFSLSSQPPPPFGGSPGHSAPADLFLMGWTGAGFAAQRTLLHSTGENNYYPAFSPDGQWVLFNRSSATSYNAPDAHLWATRSDGSGRPVDLAAANGAGDRNNSWPKWAPFVEMYAGELTEPLLWITFSSNRDYGLRLQQSSRTADMRTTQLWMAAFRPGRAGHDPTTPAFWLPFQDLGSGNHIAQWTQEVRRNGCTTNAQCAATELCSHGVCIGPPP